MHSKLFSEHPLLAALVHATKPVEERGGATVRVPLRPRYSEAPPHTLRRGLFHEST